MKNGFKKQLAALLSAATFMTSFGVIANAATSAKTIGFDNWSWTVGEETVSEGEITATIWDSIKSNSFVRGNFDDRAPNRLFDDRSTTSIEGGVFGKTTSDKALHMARNENAATTTVSDAGSAYGLKAGTSSSAEGEYTELEIYMAWDSTSADTRGIVGYFQGYSDGKSATNGSSYIIHVDTSGKVYAMGETVGKTLTANKWYKFNLVVRAGKNGINADGTANITDTNTNKYWLYIDNELVTDEDGIIFTPNARDSNTYADRDAFTGFRQLDLELRTPKAKTVTSGVWFDDCTLSQGLTEMPVYTAQNFVFAENTTAGYYEGAASGLTQYIDDRANLADVSFAGTTAGEDGEKLAANSRLNIQGTDNNKDKIFGVLVNEPKQIYTFDGSSTDPSKVVVSSGSAGISSTDTAIGGKSADAYFYSVNSGNGTTESALQFRSDNGYCIQSIDRSMPMTFEASLLLDGEFGQHYFSLNQENVYMYFNNNGSIDIHGSDGEKMRGVARYNKGQWIRVAVTVYPSAEIAEVFIDGEKVGDYLYQQGTSTYTRLKINQVFTDDAKTGVFALDDVHVYNYSRPAESTEPAVSVTSDEMTIGKNIIFAETLQQQEIESFYANIEVQGTDIDAVIYTDDTFAAESESTMVETGNILVIPRKLDNNATAYSYYYLVAGEPTDLVFSGLTEGLSSTETQSACVKLYKPLEADAKMFIAEYDGNTMVNVTMCTVPEVGFAGYVDGYEYPVSVNTDEFALNVSADNDVKVFIFDSIDVIKPLTDAVTLQ